MVVTLPLGVALTAASIPASARVAQQPSTTPVVARILPNVGPTPGGTKVNILGLNLASATAVDFGTTEVSFTVHGSSLRVTRV